MTAVNQDGRATVGVIRVVSSTDADLVAAHGRAVEREWDVPTRSACIPDQPYGVHDEASHALAVPKIVDTARALAGTGCAALLISCAADPGLREARAAVGIPVIGAGSAAAAAALATGDRVGVLGITDEVPPAVGDVLGARLVSARRPDGVTRTTDLLTDQGAAAARAAAADLVAAGAEVLLFACTGLTTIRLAPWVRSHLGVPVVDAVLAGGAVATLALGGRERYEEGDQA
ncbi:aspartate/glutamate racemase family protein [Actinoalloteichus caeruleus]|uniref:Asp/Glu/hydantoin racemase n=1 Tax=Actinoalloteichus caeruleus DSM 43889 TaxID=1120930 RepID=A0ABT1JPS5_ACTCY|nr:aspartate/glutamate racemase family protein [Actinoalloteichus caeruleus]MCP2334138.1 Asp/Glu/hydantoin racemase [Actinoalloteichus caeruleus DSM 43889]